MKKSNASRDMGRRLAILEGAVENTNEAFVTIDEAHKVIFFNRAAERLFGYRREEVIGKDLTLILSPECGADHRRAVARYLETRVPRRIGHTSELTATRKNGETFPISISFSVAQMGGKIFFTGIVRDLTEEKALQEQISRAERLAALGQIVAEITHEIRNPLVIIGSYAQQLARAPQEEKARGKLKTIAEEVRRLEKLLSGINEYYLPRKLKLERLDLNTLVREVCSLASEESRPKDIQVTCRVDGQPSWVEGDRDRLKQVLLNVVRNGIEAMGNGGSLSIQCTRSDRAEIEIADEGPGIPQDQRARIFTPFFSTKSGGTGLGLAISKRIMEEHPGGALELAGGREKGAVFRIVLPLAS